MTEKLIELLQLKVPPGSTVHFEWGNLPRGDSGLILVAWAVGAVALTLWLYKREGSASRLRKTFLGFLRLLAYSCVLIVLLEPRLAVDFERTVEGHTVLLWDTSLSMSIRDKYQEEALRQIVSDAVGLEDPLESLTRSELAWRLAQRTKLIPRLAEKNKLLVFGFDSQPRQVPGVADAGRELPEQLRPLGPATDLALAVRKALEETGGRPVAALVAITDGQLNKGEGAQGVRQMLERRGIPFYALGVGDPTPPKNLRVVKVEAEERVVLGDPMVIEGELQGRGYAGQTVDVQLWVTPREGGDGSLLERQSVNLPADNETVLVSFRHAPAAKGTFKFELRIPEQEEEPDKKDNTGHTTVTVSDDETRVLFISGGPAFEYHFLKQRLIREKTAVVSCWLQSADPRFPQEGNEQIEAMPTTVEELQEFDLVILNDPNPRDFDAVVAEAFKSFVADMGGGLLYIPGPKYTPGFLQQADLKPFRDLLPVKPGQLEDVGQGATERWPLKATADGADHPATRIAPDRELCRQIWSNLPGYFFSYPVRGEKAGATVLVRHEDPASLSEQGGRPLIVSHFFDGGPVIWIGGAESWRWRSVAERVYDRFWVGILRYLVQGRLAGGRKRLEFVLDKDEFDLGEPINVRVYAYDRNYRPYQAENLVAEVAVGGERSELTLEPISATTQPGRYQATFLPSAPGTVEFSLRPPDVPGAKPEVKAVVVTLPKVEFADPRLNEEVLGEIAGVNSGSVVAWPDMTQLPDWVESKEEKLVVAGSPILLWDRWATVLLVCLFLGLEWAIRKRSRMI